MLPERVRRGLQRKSKAVASRKLMVARLRWNWLLGPLECLKGKMPVNKPSLTGTMGEREAKVANLRERSGCLQTRDARHGTARRRASVQGRRRWKERLKSMSIRGLGKSLSGEGCDGNCDGCRRGGAAIRSEGRHANGVQVRASLLNADADVNREKDRITTHLAASFFFTPLGLSTESKLASRFQAVIRGTGALQDNENSILMARRLRATLD